MPDLSLDLHVEAPADLVWDVVGRRFHRISEWATATPASAGLSAPAVSAAPTHESNPSVAGGPTGLGGRV